MDTLNTDYKFIQDFPLDFASKTHNIDEDFLKFL